METNETLSNYYNGCLSKLVGIDLDKYKERVERDIITIAILKLRMKY